MNHNEAPNMQQSYPSPNAVAADNGGPFYNSQNPQQPTSPEDLQLAERLSRNISEDNREIPSNMTRNMAPNMAPNMPSNMASGAVMDGMPVQKFDQDPRVQQSLVNHQYQQEPQPHSVHDQSQHQLHQQHSNGQIPDMSGQQYGSPMPDGASAGRKRSKVSRACDECRRKKIRCDASDESGEGVQCSNCKRVGTDCQFSRVPQKRGPSKGYIKELADRLNHLEGALRSDNDALQHGDPQYQRRPSEEFSPVPLMEQGRKRSFSAMSNDFGGSPYQGQRAAPNWAGQPAGSFGTPQLAAGAPPMFRDGNYTVNAMPPTPTWKNAPDAPRRQTNSLDASIQMDHANVQVNELHSSIVETYSAIVHNTYPILSNDHQSFSKNASPTIQNNFFQALFGAIKSSQDPPTAPTFSPSAGCLDYGSRAANLAQLQTLLLQIIEADNIAPNIKAGQPKPSSSMLLASAVGLAFLLKLHIHKPVDNALNVELESDDSQERRLWFVLVVMDKWHAASTASPVLIPDSAIAIFPEDRAILGEAFFHLTRLSIVLGHIALVNIAPSEVPPASAHNSQIINTLLKGELDRVREENVLSFSTGSACPPLYLCYYAMRILVDVRNPDIDPTGLLKSAMNIVTQASFNAHHMGPLTYHAKALSALALIELTSYDKTRAEATLGLKTLVGNATSPSAWDGVIKQLILKKIPALLPSGAIPSAVATASQGLQRLADLATASEGDKKEDSEQSGPAPKEFAYFDDLREIIRKGYLSTFINDTSAN